MANRKDRLLNNVGGQLEAQIAADPTPTPPLAAARTSIVFSERILMLLLSQEITRLSNDRNEALRLFGSMFDPTAGAEEVERFTDRFIKAPPKVVLGYPRVGIELPCFSIVLESDEESDDVVGQYMGQTLPGEPVDETAEYEGAMFEQTYAIYVYGQHPIAVHYFYQLGKLIILGANKALIQAGLIDPHLSGGELSPEEMYMPEDVFARVLRVRAKSAMTVPRSYPFRDGANLRVGGIFREDVIVEGIRGGVGTFGVNDADE